MNLLIDLGNTRIKWRIISAQGAGEVKTFTYENRNLAQALDKSMGKEDVQLLNVYISNVAGNEVKSLVCQWSIDRFCVEPEFAVSSREKCGLINAYTQVEHLGVDRFLAMIAARLLMQGAVVVVDSGTATTIDSVGLNQEFIGGVILPGLDLMRDSLMSGANDLPPMLAGENVDVFSVDTGGAIFSGAVLATAGVVETAARRLAGLTGGEVGCIVTGGNGEVIVAHLGVRADFYSDLVLMGLFEYFRLK